MLSEGEHYFTAEDIATEKSVAQKGHIYVIDTAGVTKSHKLVIDTVGVTKSHRLVIDTTQWCYQKPHFNY